MGIFCKLSVNVYNFTCWFGDKESTQFQIGQVFEDSVTVWVSKAHLGSTSGSYHTPTLFSPNSVSFFINHAYQIITIVPILVAS